MRLAILPCLLPLAALAQQPQIDMAAIQKWNNVKNVRYHIEGVFQDWVPVNKQNPSSQVNVTDRFVIDVDWNLRQNAPIGQPKFINSKSTSAGVRTTDKDCPAPLLTGEYEHFEITAVSAGDGQPRLALTGTRNFPAGNIALQCPASKSLSPAPAKQEQVTDYVALPLPMMLAIGAVSMPGAAISPDKKSIILKGKGWTYTYTPTPLP